MIRPAMVFPGQGSQLPGMGLEMCQEFKSARETFEQASEAAGFDVASMCFNGPAEELGLTSNTQPCILAASMAAYNVLREVLDIRPLVAAGHSSGEYAALCAAGSISFADAIKCLHMRGRWMEEAVPDGVGGMAAVMGLGRDEVEKACHMASTPAEKVWPANDNAPGQVVISGHLPALDRAVSMVKEQKGKARRLKVSGPFHTRLMQPAAEKMAALLQDTRFCDPAFPVISNVDAEPYPGPGAAAALLVQQVTNAVKWRQSIEQMDRMGANIYIEAGPGKVLAGLIKRISPGARVLSMMEPENLKEIEEAISA